MATEPRCNKCGEITDSAVCCWPVGASAPPPDTVGVHRDDAAWMMALFAAAAKLKVLPSLAERMHFTNAEAKLRHLLGPKGGQ